MVTVASQTVILHPNWETPPHHRPEAVWNSERSRCITRGQPLDSLRSLGAGTLDSLRSLGAGPSRQFMESPGGLDDPAGSLRLRDLRDFRALGGPRPRA